MALCQRCRDFDIQAFQRNTFEFRGFPLDAVIHSAEAGCSFCSLLLQHLKAADNGRHQSCLSTALRRRAEEQSHVRWLSMMYRSISPTWVHFNVQRADLAPWLGGEGLNIESIGAYASNSNYRNMLDSYSSSETSRIWFHVAADKGTAAHKSQDINGHLFADKSTLSDSTFEAIRKWHLTCRLHHERCNKTLSQCDSIDTERARLPTRCIELLPRPVGGDAEGTEHDLLFFLRETIDMEGKYMILSHRWGKDTFAARTTSENLEDRCTNGFNCSTRSSVTPLFYEAGQAAFRLGVRYIWIDSVCIVQDDPADWGRESVKMAQYYQYAWLTIVAANTENARLFRNITPTDMTRVTRLPYRDKNGEQDGYFYLQGADLNALANDYQTSVRQSELVRRGWVYQERILSRRLLVFSKSCLFLQCQTGPTQSVVGDCVGDGMVESRNELTLGLSTTASSSTEPTWEDFVQRYSGLELTQLEEDRLVALSGIAAEFGRSLRQWDEESGLEGSLPNPGARYQSYLAGTWLPGLHGLLWEQARSGSRERVRGIPTWSWASMATLAANASGQNVWSGMAVQWDPPRGFEVPLCKVVCEVNEMLPVPVTKKELRPKFERARRFWPESQYGNDGRFAILGLHGKLIPVSIQRVFPSEEDVLVAAELTRHQSSSGRDMWRRTTQTQQSLITVGWASVEHPHLQTDEDCKACHDIVALVVEIIKGVYGGNGASNIMNRTTAYKVLYLRPVKVCGFEDCYERVGIGRLFSENFVTQYRNAGYNDIWLV